MRKRILLLPVLVAALLAMSVGASYAGPITLVLEDLTPGAPSPATVIVIDGGGTDEDPAADAVAFTSTVGNFFVMVTGTVAPANPGSGVPYTMDLFNFLIESTNGGKEFRATLTRSGLPTPALGAVSGTAEYYADMSATGSVQFQSWIGGTQVLEATEYTTTNPSPASSPFGPVILGGADYGVVSVLDFKFDTSGTITADTKLNVTPTGVPEPTTLLLFGPGMLGLAVFGRRVRSKSL